MTQKLVDHLFRHHYGKMVAILTRFFGLSHIETIEDAVQDTFIKATLQWRTQQPDNPEAWLTKVAKNRTIDLLRSIKSEKNRFGKISSGASSIQLNELFLDHEIEDSQLRMIFVACHPSLKPKEQIAFALKTISGFSTKEIAAALLTKDETIVKRLSRAKKAIIKNNIKFEFPQPSVINRRIDRVLEVIYLTFNEGFHSTNSNTLIREELCGEAIRLCKLLLKKEKFRTGNVYALFALLCFHAARLESKTNANNEVVDIRRQDRAKWYEPLIDMGHNALSKAIEYDDFSAFHIEAFIASEHLKAKSFQDTNWLKILSWYNQLYEMQPSAFTLLNIAIVKLQLDQIDEVKKLLDVISIAALEQRAYLYYGCYAEYFTKIGNSAKATHFYDKAIEQTSNKQEKAYLQKKRAELA